jgi:parallel beta-helix repeat protein
LIIGGNYSYNMRNGVKVDAESARIVIYQNQINGNYYGGIQLGMYSSYTLKDALIDNNTFLGNIGPNANLLLSYCSGVNVTNNFISDAVGGVNTNGVRITTSSGIIVEGNRIFNSADYGVYLVGNSASLDNDNVICSNEISSNGDSGVRIRFNSGYTVILNRISSNVNYGLSTADSDSGLIVFNTFQGNTKGVTTGLGETDVFLFNN